MMPFLLQFATYLLWSCAAIFLVINAARGVPAQQWGRAAAVLMVCVVVLAIVFLIPNREPERLRPKGHELTFEGFAANRPVPKRMTTVTSHEQDYYVWIGELGKNGAFPSGPSCYVFDSKGDLVTWAWQTGEGGAIEEWSKAKGKDITVEQALETIRRRK
jgi:hypothetical protein